MRRHVYLGLVLAVLVVVPGRCAAQPRCGPLYSLPADGTWVEYVWQATLPDGREQMGTLRISSVGSRQVQGVRHRWVEIKKATRQGAETRVQLRNLLVAEKAFADSQSLQGNVAEVFAQDDLKGPVTRLTTSRLEEFISLGIEGPGAILKTVGDEEELATGLGKFPARHVSAQGKRGDRTLEYHGWLTGKVPFGWAKFEIRERSGKKPESVFRAVATRSGADARSEVSETRAK
jgi:hypothetical protein